MVYYSNRYFFLETTLSRFLARSLSKTQHLHAIRLLKLTLTHTHTHAQMPAPIVGDEFQHILRVMNTNIEGRERVCIAITAIRGVGRRFASLILKKAEIDPTKRAGTLSQEELDKIVAILQDPLKFKIPAWFLNRQRDTVTGKTSQLHAQQVAGKLREDLERLKKMRCHRGLRHYWGIRVRGHRTKTSGRTRGRH